MCASYKNHHSPLGEISKSTKKIHCVCECVVCAREVLSSSSGATGVWFSDGDEWVRGENETVKQSGCESSHQRSHPVDIVVPPPVWQGGEDGRAEAPGRVEGASCEGVAGEGQVEEVSAPLNEVSTLHTQPTPLLTSPLITVMCIHCMNTSLYLMAGTSK